MADGSETDRLRAVYAWASAKRDKLVATLAFVEEALVQEGYPSEHLTLDQYEEEPGAEGTP